VIVNALKWRYAITKAAARKNPAEAIRESLESGDHAEVLGFLIRRDYEPGRTLKVKMNAMRTGIHTSPKPRHFEFGESAHTRCPWGP
jgi:hypothetical protein